MCKDKLDWDSVVPEYLHPVWEKWRQDIMELEKLEIPRCYKPKDFGDIKAIELHHISDASESGIGQSSYLRIVNNLGEVHCSFVIGKARVTPVKVVTVPRLELVAATISAKMSTFLRNELTYENVTEFFWTDSRIVLGYLKNEAKRFHTFVANRVQQIRNQTDPDRWSFVKSEPNVADLASRVLTAKQLVEDSTWLAGPPFLWQKEVIDVDQEIAYSLDEADDEVKNATVLSSMTGSGKIGVPEFEEAEKEILKILQREHFEKELEIIQSHSGVVEDRTATRDRNRKIKKYSSLFRLDPFLDKNGLIRVGGRIQRANIPHELKHPVIIPSKSHLTKLLITHYHQKVNHMGRGITHNELRQNG
ncbi:hypothetical protein SNE40_009545 [Patella caerulea]|uniref:Uncharacterized protein n=1 Tax=Patella caerulea TaxID=87958 RepID=A0AAN8JPV9_PATCE